MPSLEPVVSNTTPLITLAGIGLLELLPQLYQTVWIPEAVYVEYQTGRGRHPGSPDLNSQTWLSVHAVASDPRVPEALDAGEAEVIALALTSRAARVAG